jgi:hypothetical protein
MAEASRHRAWRSGRTHMANVGWQWCVHHSATHLPTSQHHSTTHLPTSQHHPPTHLPTSQHHSSSIALRQHNSTASAQQHGSSTTSAPPKHHRNTSSPHNITAHTVIYFVGGVHPKTATPVPVFSPTDTCLYLAIATCSSRRNLA